MKNIIKIIFDIFTGLFDNGKRVKFDMEIPEDIIQIKNVFKKNGHKLFVVGGAVRDAVLGKIPKDFDLATDALPDKVEKMMQSAGFKTLPTGKAFGVINVFTESNEFEIATFRNDLSGGRRPDAVSFTNIKGDVKRRDLTINALFFDIDKKVIVDLVGGLDDLMKRVIRTVGSAEERFGEDKLRILRAIRFAARFGSDLDPETEAALLKDASLKGVSNERIRDEFIKGIKSAKSTKHFLDLINEFGLFKFIFKGLEVDLFFIESLRRNETDVIMLIASLLKKNSIEVLNKKLNELTFSTEEIKGITFLISLIRLDMSNAVALKKAQQNSGVSGIQILTFGDNEGVFTRLLDAFIVFELTVSGQEVMDSTGLKPSKELGQLIQKMETDNFKKLLS